MYKIFTHSDKEVLDGLNIKAGQVIHEYGKTAKECLEHGVKNGVSFSCARLNDQDLTDLSLSGIDLSFAQLNNTNFTDSELDGADFSHADLNYTDFSSCLLLDAQLVSVLNHCNFTNANLASTSFNGSGLANCTFIRAELQCRDEEGLVSTADINNCQFKDCDFTDCDIKGLTFYELLNCKL